MQLPMPLHSKSQPEPSQLRVQLPMPEQRHVSPAVQVSLLLPMQPSASMATNSATIAIPERVFFMLRGSPQGMQPDKPPGTIATRLVDLRSHGADPAGQHAWRRGSDI